MDRLLFMTEKELDNQLSKIKIQLKDAAEALNPAHYKKLQEKYNKLLAIKIPLWGSDGD